MKPAYQIRHGHKQGDCIGPKVQALISQLVALRKNLAHNPSFYQGQIDAITSRLDAITRNDKGQFSNWKIILETHERNAK